jgi:hypothetical protein
MAVQGDIHKEYAVLVTWKHDPFPRTKEAFHTLQLFCDSYPAYHYSVLNEYLNTNDTPFENASLIIEKILSAYSTIKPVPDKPDVREKLFWEFDVPNIDWQDGYRTIIKRVLERGTKPEWDELVRYYGLPKVIHTITKEISYLPDDITEEVCTFFNLKKEDLRCYTRKPFLPGHWS